MSISLLRLSTPLAGACLSFAALAPSFAADAQANRSERFYAMTPLVSDGAVAARFQDPSLKNPWGVAFNPAGYSWVANNGTGTSTLYDGNGVPQSLVVAVPAAVGDRKSVV